MAKRKRITEQPPNIKARKLQPCRLLSLPPEIRNMIWKAVIAPDPILLYGRSYSEGAPMQVESLTSIPLPSTYRNNRCDDLHIHQPSKSAFRRKRPGVPGPLSWLRTNRQIYAEARPILQSNLTLQICDPLVLSAFLSNPSKSIIRPETLRSLSLCIKVKIESDLCDGFKFADGESHGAHKWGKAYMAGVCCCPWCFALGSLNIQLTDKLSSLRELRLRVYFTCKRGQGNTRPVIGHFQDGTPQKGQLHRPEFPIPLVWVDDRKKIDELADDLCTEKPLQIFSEEKKLESLDVQFCTEKIQHDLGNRCPEPPDKCWCLGRSINEQALPMSDITKALEKRLKGDASGNS